MWSDNTMQSIRNMLVGAACVLATSIAFAAPPRVEQFDVATWEQLKNELSRPSVVVFTATYCANCPAVLEGLSNALKKRGLSGDVIAVVIDEADTAELLSSKHYAHASRLFLFQGNEAALRYRVDPKWRGVTPYAALFPKEGAPVFAAGTPSDAAIEAWLGRSGFQPDVEASE